MTAMRNTNTYATNPLTTQQCLQEQIKKVTVPVEHDRILNSYTEDSRSTYGL